MEKKVLKITKYEKVYGRTAFRIQIAASIWKLWSRIQKEKNVDIEWLAQRMGKDKKTVTKLLKGLGAWKIETIADLLEAMESRIGVIEMMTYEEIGKNYDQNKKI